MNSEERPMKATATARMRRPLIIGHNCGYIGYDEQPYSRAATVKAYKDCDYLEIDLKLKNNEWWYFHDGKWGVGKRKNGIPFDVFLRDFRYAERMWRGKLDASKVKSKPGIFLDLKKCLKSQTDVNKLMDYLNEKYKRKRIPEGTPLMIFTGRGPPGRGVYRHTTLYFVKWLYKSRKPLMEIMRREFCPRLTLVTREIEGIKERGLADWRGILEPFKKSQLNEDEREWFKNNFGETFGWAFNPERFWLPRYDFAEIIENGITVIPWFEDNISKIRKFFEKKDLVGKPDEAEIAGLPKKLNESPSMWIKVIVGLLGIFWLYKSYHTESVKSLRWGIITFAPNLLKDAFKKYSFPQRLVKQSQS